MSSELVLRAYEDGDAAGAAAVLAAAMPWALVEERAWRHFQSRIPETAELGQWVAVADGRVVALGNAFLTWWTTTAGAASVGVFVHPDVSRRGVGARLAKLCREHLRSIGARHIRTNCEEAYLPFARRHGLEPVSRKRVSAVDPRGVSGERDPRIVPYSELADRLEELYRLDIETTKDMPNEGEFELTFEQWRKDFWEDPLLSLDGSFAAVVDGRLAAATNLRVSGLRASNGFTGTLREFRRQGLAAAVKTAGLLWACERGIERVHTFNDETNAAMLSVNEKLGYRPWLSIVDVEGSV